MGLGNMEPGLVGVSKSWGKITTSDTTDLTTPARYILAITAGDIKVGKLDGTSEVIASVAAGTYLMGAVARVYTTGTHASPNIIGFY